MVAALALGEALVDIVRTPAGVVTEHPGGSVANVAVALARLGVATRLGTWIGRDAPGHRVAAWLAESGVELTAGSRDASRTPSARATLDATGSASYEFDLEWVLPGGLELPPAGSVVHTGSVAALLEPGATALHEYVLAARATACVTYDPNIRPALTADRQLAVRGVEAFVAVADVVKASADDLAWLYPGAPLDDVAERWLGTGPAVVVVTRGAGGALAWCRAGGVEHQPRQAVPVVDTVGAGDAFMGALVWGLAEAGLLERAARPQLDAVDVTTLAGVVATAARAAELSVGRAGADPPTLGELRAASGRVAP